jgi:hypothetical protein
MEGLPKDLIVYIANVVRLVSVVNLVAMSSTCVRFRAILKDAVNGEKVGNVHLKWMKRWKRREQSMMQAWCSKVYRAFMRDDDRLHFQPLVKHSRKLLHLHLIAGNSAEEWATCCYKCREVLLYPEVSCFIDWWQNKDCLLCTREAEYCFINNGSAPESEEENMFTFSNKDD